MPNKKKVIVIGLVGSLMLMSSGPALAQSAPSELCTWEEGESLGEYLGDRLWGEFIGECIGVPYDTQPRPEETKN